MLKEPAGIWYVRRQTARSKGVPRGEAARGGGRGVLMVGSLVLGVGIFLVVVLVRLTTRVVVVVGIFFLGHSRSLLLRDTVGMGGWLMPGIIAGRVDGLILR